MKKIFKIFICLMIVLSFYLFKEAKVEAKSCNIRTEESGNTDGYDYFGLRMEAKSGTTNQYLIYRDKTADEYPNIKFKIANILPSPKANMALNSSDYMEIGYGKSNAITVTINGSVDNDHSRENGDYRDLGEIESPVYVKFLVDLSKYECKGSYTSYVVQSCAEALKEDEDQCNDEYGSYDDGGTTSAPTSKQFDNAFNRAKNNASIKFTSDKYTIDTLRDYLNKNTQTFKCDTNLHKKSSEIKYDFDDNLYTSGKSTDEDPLGDENYYLETNRKYMYAKSSKIVEAGSYEFHLKSPTKKESEPIKCKVTCEEAVEVEYGPPVASKAGLCFEYKVRVESRVKCTAESPNEPTNYKICTPYPYCHRAGTHHKQGGPNEEYEQCINKCDGGKYTQKCSNSCYKKVYLNSTNTKATSYFDTTLTATPLSDSITPDEWKKAAIAGNAKVINTSNHRISKKGTCDWSYCSAHPNGYYYVSNGKIYWSKGLDDSDKTSHGRWYFKHNWGIAGHDYCKIHSDTAIPKTKSCKETCEWRGCSGKVYLNYGTKKLDSNRNEELYQKAKDECDTYTKCSTETAEFTISADYINGNSETKKIKFPYSTEKDKLSTCQSSAKTNTLKDKGTTLNAELISNDSYDNCYSGKTDCSTENYYLSEWTFPGTWINKKTGEISYKYKEETDTIWRNKTKKFCIPRDAKTVNALWYEWYLHVVEEKSAINDDECLNSEEGKVINQSTFTDKSKVEYNIKANTTHFGYFNWKIDIECFYAIKTRTDGGPTCGTGQRNRTVDNQDIFPSTRGKNSNGTEKIGFNWTGKATLTNKLVSSTSDYITNPETVRAYIEKNKNTIYLNDNYVDYEFDLSKTDLTNIKSYNSLISLGKFCGSVDTTTNGYKDSSNEEITIVHYKSNLFSERGITSTCPKGSNKTISVKTLPNDTALKCNNKTNSANATSCGLN